MRGRIKTETVKKLAKGEILADDQLKGFIARKLPSGEVSYGFRYRDRASGRQRWIGLGLHGQLTPDQARGLAKQHAGTVAAQRDPMAEKKAARKASAKAAQSTVNGMLDAFLANYVRQRELRSGNEIKSIFDRLVRPAIGKRSIYDLKRSDVTKMLDGIKAPVMADRTLAHFRSACNWQAARDDNFIVPIARGMARIRPADIARRRVLDDQEIRDVWSALESPKVSSVFGRIVKILILTAARREEVAGMTWAEIDGDMWLIPDRRDKIKIGKAVPLTKDVQTILGDAGTGFVFSTAGGARPFQGFSKSKIALDKAINERRQKDGRDPMEPWRIHDLRRTARSLMSRAGVSSDIAERVLGHVIPGVRGIYDRHEYAAEKADALMKLAALVDRILNPPADNVTDFRRQA